MRRAMVILMMSPAVLAGCSAAGDRTRPIDALQRASLFTLNERELDTYLAWLSKQPMSTTQRIAHLARKNLGQPYRLGLLGEFPFELHDADPMYCLAASDCVTFVEQTYAMALAHDWPSFFLTLQRIRYQDGRIGMLTRNHFVEADWNPNNAWLFEEVTASLAGDGARPMRSRVDQAAFFAQYGLGQDLPVQVVEGSYVPKQQLPQIADRLRDGDVIEFVKDGGEWQYVSHMGLVLRDAAGRVTMIHASQPCVREESLQEYLARQENTAGFRIVRMIEGAGRPPGG